MTLTYSQSDLKEIVNSNLHSKFDQVTSPQAVMNRGVRFTLSDVDLRSAKRSAPLSPSLSSYEFNYALPTDAKGEKVIDLRKQVNRSSFERWVLCDDAEFDRLKNRHRYRLAVRDENGFKTLRVSAAEGNVSEILNACNSLTANGTFTPGADASNVTLDELEYITESGSINFDMAKGAATGYVEVTGMSQVDLSDWDEQGSVYLWVYIPDYADAQGDTVTNFILRWGNDSSNYWSRTVTVTNEGTAFHDGWNLLRFDWDGSASETGTVSPSAIDYLRLTVTKSTSLEADTDWRIDNIVFIVGEIYEIVYYSKYGWTTSSGTYIEESTATSDLLVADADEVELIGLKTAEYGAIELKEYDDAKIFADLYDDAKKRYQANNPSEALKKTATTGGLPRLHRLGRA